MTEPSTYLSADLPPVNISELEFDALNALAFAISHKQPELSGMLLAELDRAQVHPATSLPPGTVTMNSRVEFRDEGNGNVRTVQIVFPHLADISRDRISIVTPVAAALIGLSEGDAIPCRFHDGQDRFLRVLKVYPPEEG
ncbi:MAG: transcription elongation factor GreAB [Hyphomonas sp.]|nr:transcription elongation factor GreAB [Hyphomonas sp.]|tara:strand:+ start:2608 stop:3027 length:420 start_codon:yes stop_codon:yes gene_type:complete